MKSKRILSIMLSIMMLLSIIPANVFTTEEVSSTISTSVLFDEQQEGDSELFASDETTVTETQYEDKEDIAPESITIEADYSDVINGTFVLKKGDEVALTALDQNGNETPVKWSTSSYRSISIDEDSGVITVINDIYGGSTSYWYVTATSTIDTSIKKQNHRFSATGYLMSSYNKNKSVALSEDGQTAKTASTTGGSGGHNIWSFNIPDGVGVVRTDPGSNNSVTFDLLRPGTITATFKLDTNEELTDTATINVTGVAVEDNEGKSGKTYLSITAENPNPTVQLSAYTEADKTVASWESANEEVATVDENGLVTAKGVGSTFIYAKDSANQKGGIKVVVESADIPYFESLEFLTTALTTNAWLKDTTFSPTKTEYDLPIKSYSTSKITIQATTLYDTDKYTAIAEYTDINGDKQIVNVNSGAITYLDNQPFGSSVVTITISDNENAENKTVYTFNVTRPRDTSKAINSSGIVLIPTERSLSSTSYMGYLDIESSAVAEGTMLKIDADKNPIYSNSGKLQTGVSGTQYLYRTFIYDDAESFSLNLSSSTAYAHLRYSVDNGETWKELAQGGGLTDAITFGEDIQKEILVQIIDDSAYTANVNAEKDGFFETTPTEYKVYVDKVIFTSPKMLTAASTYGDWYPAFNSDTYSNRIIIENSLEAPTLTYTVTDGSTVKIGSSVQTPDENGIYTTVLTTSTKIEITSADGSFTNAYSIGFTKKSKLDVPNKIVDYLCMGSQYTNGGYGVGPEATLAGSMKSLGNFGGYITYYYDEPITDNPNNKFGMDFYVIGNSQETNIGSMAELGQVYVSEDNETWYALAGSEHYEDKAHWDYEITYTKGDDGKARWTDNKGNVGAQATVWPSASVYYLNDVSSKDSYTFKGIVFESQQGSIMGDSTTASFAASSKFGYTDYYASNVSGTTLTDVNSYVENPSKANGFDVKWAVDENGTPIDVTDKEFHYIKVATASNIWAGGFNEKSTEVTYVARTTPQAEAVGKTTAPASVTISDGVEEKTVNLAEGQQVYSVNLDNMKYVSVKVNETADDDNIYINNQRVASGVYAEGFKVTKENGETLVRVIVQNGDKEPALYLLKLTSSATESDELIEGIKIDASGTIREATTNNGTDYVASVGHKIDSIVINPMAAQNVAITINNAEIAETYALEYGKNTFEITATDGEKTQTVNLFVTRDNAPNSSGNNITVKFTLYGDEKHGTSETHIYKNNKSKMPVWISNKSYTVDSNSTVLDVFEMALEEADITWKNDGGNYISKINGLAEFDNGELSGWMYLLNGDYSSLGVAEQSLKNGDRIIFHYTDDYTQERASDSWTSSLTSSLSGTTTKKDKTTEEANETTEATPDTVSTVNIEQFTDIKADDWYYEDIKKAVEIGLLNGVSESLFAPNDNMTRGMLVTILHRYDGEKEADNEISFTDFKNDEWYSEAVSWAAETGIVSGYGNGMFGIDDYITRGQLVTILYRYAGKKTETDLSGFIDVDEIEEWAKDAFAWAVGKNLVLGDDNKALNSNGFATRAEATAIFMRYMTQSK